MYTRMRHLRRDVHTGRPLKGATCAYLRRGPVRFADPNYKLHRTRFSVEWWRGGHSSTSGRRRCSGARCCNSHTAAHRRRMSSTGEGHARTASQGAQTTSWCPYRHHGRTGHAGHSEHQSNVTHVPGGGGAGGAHVLRWWLRHRLYSATHTTTAAISPMTRPTIRPVRAALEGLSNACKQIRTSIRHKTRQTWKE